MIARFALAVTLLLGGCHDESPSVTVGAAESNERFAVGDVLRYRFDWRVDTRSDAGGIFPDEIEVAAGLVLVGELELRVHPEVEEGSLLGVTIARLDRSSLTLMEHDALADRDELVGHESFVVLGRDGEVRAHYFAADAPPLLRHVMTGLLAQVDLRVPARTRASHTVRVPTGTGLASAEYSWTSDTTLVRSLRAYDRFDAYAAAEPVEVIGSLEVTLDDDDLPTHMEGAEQVSAVGDDIEVDGFRSRTTFALDRVALVHGDIGASPPLSTLDRRDPLAPPDDADARRMLAQRFAEGLTAVDVEMMVHGASAGLRPSPDFIVRATGRLRGWPELAAELEPLFATYDDARARSLLIDMLASAGTTQAQTILCEVLDEPGLRDDEAWSSWVQRFAFLWRPTAETAHFLLGQHARASGDPNRQRALLYPMGAVASRIEPVDAATALLLRERVRSSLRAAQTPDDVVAALGGLGNAGSSEDIELVLAHRSDEEPLVRAQVASALRHMRTPAVTDALLGLILDRDPFVATAALSALDRRGEDPEASVRLAAVALGGAFVPDIAGRMVTALGRRLDETPSVRTALASMHARAADPRERERIAAMLDPGA